MFNTPTQVENPKYFRTSAVQCLQFLAREAGEAGEGRISMILRQAARDIRQISDEKTVSPDFQGGTTPELLALLNEAYELARNRRLKFPAFLIGIAIDGFLTADIGQHEGFYQKMRAS